MLGSGSNNLTLYLEPTGQFENPSRLGIGTKVEVGNRSIVALELRAYVVVEETLTLESTAAAIVDKFSVKGLVQNTVGGAKQLFFNPELLERLKSVKP